jgi:hypothetical protein
MEVRAFATVSNTPKAVFSASASFVNTVNLFSLAISPLRIRFW